MKLILVLAFLAAALGGGYLAYRSSQQDNSLSAELAAKERELEEAKAELERDKNGKIRDLQQKLDRLKDEIARQEKLVADLDARLNQLDATKSTEDSVKLRSQIQDEQAEVDTLQRRLDDYRAGINQEATNLQAAKAQDADTRRTTLASYDAAITQKQSDMRDLRQRLHDRRALGLSMDQILATQNALKVDQGDLDALKTSYAQAKAGDPTQKQNENQVAAELSAARSDQKQLAADLAAARKRLRDLQDQAKKEDKGINEGFSHRDQLENQFLVAKQKLENLRERLAALEKAAAEP